MTYIFHSIWQKGPSKIWAPERDPLHVITYYDLSSHKTHQFEIRWLRPKPVFDLFILTLLWIIPAWFATSLLLLP